MPHSRDLPVALEVAADLLEVRRLAAFLRQSCAAAGVDEAVALDCELALVEAANNVVEHGYTGHAGGTMAVEIRAEKDRVNIILSDRGRPVPDDFFDHCRVVPLDAEGGRGCGIIRACVDEIAYSSQDGFNRLTMVKRL